MQIDENTVFLNFFKHVWLFDTLPCHFCQLGFYFSLSNQCVSVENVPPPSQALGKKSTFLVLCKHIGVPLSGSGSTWAVMKSDVFAAGNQVSLKLHMLFFCSQSSTWSSCEWVLIRVFGGQSLSCWSQTSFEGGFGVFGTNERFDWDATRAQSRVTIN